VHGVWFQGTFAIPITWANGWRRELCRSCSSNLYILIQVTRPFSCPFWIGHQMVAPHLFIILGKLSDKHLHFRYFLLLISTGWRLKDPGLIRFTQAQSFCPQQYLKQKCKSVTKRLPTISRFLHSPKNMSPNESKVPGPLDRAAPLLHWHLQPLSLHWEGWRGIWIAR